MPIRARRPRATGALERILALGVAVCAASRALAQPAIAPPDDPFCAVLTGPCVRPPYVAVVSAFPAEIEPLLAAADVTETLAHDGRSYYVGQLGDTRVVLVRGGIGLVNAEATARWLVERFRLRAIVFSGVAGSPLEIGDVAVPARWSDGTRTFPVDAKLLAIAETLPGKQVPLESCTPVPPDPPGPEVCLGRTPRIVVGGDGESRDPYGGNPAPCASGGGPVLGCEPLRAPLRSGAAPEPQAVDMETAAVAAVAAEAGVPFIGFRGVSDGGGDPLGLPGFPSQFFAYYRLAADNAALAVTAFLAARVAARTDAADGNAASAAEARVGAACDWERAASRTCRDARTPRAVTRYVARACALTAEAATALPGSAAATGAARRARRRWARAADLVRSGPPYSSRCRRALHAGLRERAEAP